MRIANLTHGALFMLGAYIGASHPQVRAQPLARGAARRRSWSRRSAACVERFILRKLAGNVLGQVLVTLGIAFMIADFCLIVWGGDPIPVPTPQYLQQPLRFAGLRVPDLPPGGDR